LALRESRIAVAVSAIGSARLHDLAGSAFERRPAGSRDAAHNRPEFHQFGCGSNTRASAAPPLNSVIIAAIAVRANAFTIERSKLRYVASMAPNPFKRFA
jgi:hypothetical protein